MTPVTVYTTGACATSRAVAAFLTRHAIPFTEKNVNHDPQARAELLARADVSSLPVTRVGDQIFSGTFRDQREGIARALRLTGGR
ncbi:hypothetical protein DAETH_46620 (plasmid) [Deinococcus aetherius]|uniref:Glutaredoxin domain-containing protein n=1 Tax=Deinococcus aetherius TaxID=200252 RepID=A0ABM8ALH4_9DEIO|nr:glutaredoxin family protein [Deinococcus aetherius]BDP44693.1 hypothetical protein DAETH_46620 [Deinococcus aetherius]